VPPVVGMGMGHEAVVPQPQASQDTSRTYTNAPARMLGLSERRDA
jgi:hypothetical protein